MSRLSMSMNNFKKIKSDKDSTTLQHKDGHSITIAHSGLSPKYRGQLAALPLHKAEGGMIADSSNQGASMKENYGKRKKLSNGGKVQQDEDETDQVYPPADESQRKTVQTTNEDGSHDETEPRYYAEGTPNVMPQPQPQDSQDDDGGSTPAQQPVINVFANGQQQPQQPAMQQAPAQQGAQDLNAAQQGTQQQLQQQNPMAAAVQQSDSSAQAQQNSPDQSVVSQDPQAMTARSALAQEAAGARAGAEVTGRVQEAQAPIQGAAANQLAELHNNTQAALNKAQEEYGAIQHDLLNRHIDANQFINKMSTGSKIMTGIGYILGAAAAPLTGGNLAQQYINRQIDSDIADQKNKINVEQNLMSLNLQHQGSLREAETSARNQIHAIVDHAIQEQANLAGTPMAKAAAQQYIGKRMGEQINQIRQDALWQTIQDQQQKTRQAGQPGQQSTQRAPDPRQLTQALMLTNPEAAKLRQSMTWVNPDGNAEMSTVGAIPDDVRKTLAAQETLLDANKNMQDFVQQHSGTLDKLSPSERAKAESLALELQQRYRQGVGASVSGEEQKTINNIVSSDPLALVKTWNSQPKYQALHDSILSAHNVQRKAAGLSKLPANTYQGAQAPQIKTVGGVKYMRGPNGQAIKVQ